MCCTHQCHVVGTVNLCLTWCPEQTQADKGLHLRLYSQTHVQQINSYYGPS